MSIGKNLEFQLNQIQAGFSNPDSSISKLSVLGLNQKQRENNSKQKAFQEFSSKFDSSTPKALIGAFWAVEVRDAVGSQPNSRQMQEIRINMGINPNQPDPTFDQIKTHYESMFQKTYYSPTLEPRRYPNRNFPGIN
jgi:hypothetical protein